MGHYKKTTLTILLLLLLSISAASAVSVTANFTASTISGTAPLTVKFTDTSINASAWNWTFGDGNNSDAQSPTNIYSAPGTYTVTLNATNGTDFNTSTKKITVNLPPLTLNINPVKKDIQSNFSELKAFTATANQNATFTWYLNNAQVKTESSVSSSTYTNNTASVGTYNLTVNVTNTKQTYSNKWNWTVSAAPATAPKITQDPASSVSDTTGSSRTFTATIDQLVNLTWILNDVTLGPVNESVTGAQSITLPAVVGNHNLTVVAENENGTVSKKWDWTVTDPVVTLKITASSPSTNPETVQGAPQVFNVSTDQTATVKWYVNGVETQTNSSVTSAQFSIIKPVGNYNITAKASIDGANVSKTWTWKVHPKNYFTGDRIWDENAKQSKKYTWDAKSFSGFFYDLNTGFSSETMTITDISRTIGSGKLVYRTAPVSSDFEYTAWGKYQVIGFMAEKYFAGYSSDTKITGVTPVSLMSSGYLSKVLIDNDEKKTIYSGSSFALEEGYRINVVQVDRAGSKVMVTLSKDGKEVDTFVFNEKDKKPLIYERDIGGSDKVPIIIVNFESIFSGAESNAVFIEGIFQISENCVKLEGGTKYDKMKVSGFSDTYIEMENDGSLSLSKGKTIPIMGKIKFIVADDNTLRFAPFVDMSAPGKYELRGTVAEGNELLIWTPLNFEGFYYDINEGLRTEKLELKSINGRTIAKGQLIYTSSPAEVAFEHTDWGKYKVVGFMAKKYFAGYPANVFGKTKGGVDIISSGLLSKVLIDDDDRKSVYSGSSIVLEEGYRLNIDQVDKKGEQVLVSLTKNGKNVETTAVRGQNTYIYETKLGDSDKVPIIAVYFDNIFTGSESTAVFVRGIFQISEDCLKIEDGKTFGKMEITGTGGNITMANKESITLSKDKSVTVMGDIGFKAADSNTVRYYPFVEVTTAPAQSLSVKADSAIVTKGTKVTITVTSRGGAIGDATVKAGSSTIGTTDNEGRIVYTSSAIGKITIAASKDGYSSGSAEIEVISPDDDTRKMIIECSPKDVFEGSQVNLTVLSAIGGKPIEGAVVSVNGKTIGATSTSGTVVHTMTGHGVYKVTAVKTGMIDATLDLNVKEVAARFEFTNLVISPLDVRQGKAATITVDVKNTGTAEGICKAELLVNDTVVANQTVTLGVGKTEKLTFKHTEKEPGTYIAKVGGLSASYEVFKSSSAIWYVLGAIVVLAGAGLAYLFTAGGWTADMAQAKVDEAINTIKDLINKR